MGAPLQAGTLAAQVLAMTLGVPLVPVNHCIAHAEMGRTITKTHNPVILYVSGGNTQVSNLIYFSIFYYEHLQILTYARNKYYIIGETLDIAAGNCIDRFGRHIKLPNEPCPGYNVEQHAKKGKNTILLPYPIKGMDMSFSGVLTTVTKRYDSGKNKKEDEKEYDEADLCATLQEQLFTMMVETTERALSVTKLNSVLIVGGVGCNKRLQEMMRIMCEERGATLGATDSRYCIDNGAMIAHTGALMYNCGVYINPFEGAPYTQRYRTDDVKVIWRDNTVFEV